MDGGLSGRSGCPAPIPAYNRTQRVTRTQVGPQTFTRTALSTLCPADNHCRVDYVKRGHRFAAL